MLALRLPTGSAVCAGLRSMDTGQLQEMAEAAPELAELAARDRATFERFMSDQAAENAALVARLLSREDEAPKPKSTSRKASR